MNKSVKSRPMPAPLSPDLLEKMVGTPRCQVACGKHP
jgi:hypothetical protein